MYKKFILGGAFLFIGILFLSGCNFSHKNVDNTDKIKIAATIFPLYDIVKTVGGEKIDSILILPPGSSPHTYEVSPGQINDARGSRLLFTVGGEVDNWAKDIANVIDGVKIVELNQFLKLKPFNPFNSNHISLDAPESGGGSVDMDPHAWLDPNNAQIMAEQISTDLGEVDPINKDYYETNAQNFVVSLKSKDQEWQNKLQNLAKKDLIVFHDAWGYFADHFDLHIAGAFEPFPGKSPTPQYLINLQNLIKKDNITALFVEPQLSKEAISTFASDLKVKVNILDPLGGIDGRNSYLSLIDFNVNNIYEALK
ncbi:MAG: metal ABC transporter substrate-binding protein [Candidatus Magasanikbacteria bacterium]